LTGALARRKNQPMNEYLPRRALMTLWTAAHLGVSPASRTIQNLDEWQVGLLYEVAMNFPVEGLRRSYFERQRSVQNIEDDDIAEMGYTQDEIDRIKGKPH
jgi:hypothetical protein